MRIVVLGATGVVGRHVVAAAQERGATAVLASRRTGTDVATGAGLDEALLGADVVIDVTNAPGLSRKAAAEFFRAAARNVQASAVRADVTHLVVLSIVGIEQCRAFPYYDAKLAQERHYLDGPVDATVLRATQFHEFAGQVLDRSASSPVAVVPRMRVQTVAARAVAAELVAAALRGPAHGVLADVAGPAPAADLVARAREVARRRGGPRRVLGVPVPGAAGRAMSSGALLPGPDATLVGPGFTEWLGGPDGPAVTKGR